MDDRTDSGLTRLLAPVAICLILGSIVLRWCASSSASGLGFNIFAHTLMLAGAAIWLADAAIRGAWTFRWTWPGVALLLFALVGIFSIQRASYKLAALEHAFVYGTLAVLYFAILNLFATRRPALLTLVLGFVVFVALYSILQRFVVFPEIRKETLGDPRRSSPEFEARLLSNEVWGTFFYPNTLAGFFALTLPIAAGAAIDAKRARWIGLVPLVAGLFALFLTGSRGGWVAAAAGFGLFAALQATRNREALRKAIWIAVPSATAIVLVLMIAGPLAPGKLGNASMRMRDIYWSAAVKIAKEHPVAGVGLDNYQEYYPAYRGQTQQEVRKVHNDYLQILVEMGIPGFLAFLVFVLGTARLGSRSSESLPPEDPLRRGGWLLSGVGAVAVVIAWIFTGVFGESLLVFGMIAIAWIGFTAFAYPPAAEVSESTRLGAVAGFVAMLVHMFVDFDFYDYGTATALVLGAALVAVLGGRARTVELDRMPAAVTAGLLALLLLPALFFAPKLLDADQIKSDVSSLLNEARRADAQADSLEGQGKPAEARGRRVAAASNYTRALELVQKGEKLNFLDAEFYLEHAMLRQTLWDKFRAKNDYSAEAMMEMELHQDTAMQALENALRVRPRSFAARMSLGLFYRRIAQFHAEAAVEAERAHQKTERISLLRQQSFQYRVKSSDHFQEAIKLYPSQAHARYCAARAVEESGTGDPRRDYAEALLLSDLAALERLERLQLTLWQKVRALIALDRGAEARSTVEAHLRTNLVALNPKPGQQRMAIEDLLGAERKGDKLRRLLGEEYEGRVKELVDGVLLEFLSRLPKSDS